MIARASGRWVGSGELFQEAIRIGLQVGVDDLARRPSLDHAQRDVGRYPMQPGRQRGSRLVAPKPAPGARERLLQRVVGVVQRPEHSVEVDMKRAAVGTRELYERLLVTALRGDEHPIAGLDHEAAGTGHGPPSSVQDEGL